MVRELSPDKREKYLNAALKLFVSRGMQNTSTAEIAREAGTAAGTLFLYFPTKQDLINELVLKISQEEAATITSRLDASMPARDMFFTIWDGSIRWLLDHMDAYQFSQQVRDSGMIPEEVVLETGKQFSFYYNAIQKGLAEGSLKPLPPELIGGFLYQDIVAVMNYTRTQANPIKIEQTIQQGFEIFWDGISKQSINTKE
jgi:AcrR family transcriptional regulator